VAFNVQFKSGFIRVFSDHTNKTGNMKKLIDYYKKHWIITTIVAIIATLFFVALFNNDKQTKKASQTPDNPQNISQSSKTSAEWPDADTLSAFELLAKYEANEVNADDLYKGKSFYVKGTIDHIGKDILDNIYVTLFTGNGIRSIQCYYDIPAQKKIVADFRKGDKITIYGTCDGLMMNVLMKNCKTVDRVPHE
jgi:hypothetical protein